MEDGEGRGRGPNGDQGSHRTARGDLSSVNCLPGDRRNGQPLADLLVKEWHTDGGSSDRF